MSIFIFRRDFRLSDNIGLINLLKDSTDSIIPIFIFTPKQIKRNSYKSYNCIQFMIDSLKDLNESIKKNGSKLNIFYGEDIDVIKEISKNIKINKVYTNTDYTTFATKRDKKLKKELDKINIEFKYFHDICLFEPGTVKNKTDGIYQKFTPFYKLLLTREVPKVIKGKFKDKFKNISSNEFSISWKDTEKFHKNNNKINVLGGRKFAKEILKGISKWDKYSNNHNNLNYETTFLSAYLKFGCISIREAYHLIKDKFGLNNSILRQLYWREFYYHLGYSFPHVLGKSLKPDYDKIKWSNKKDTLEAWKNANTGFPIVDACMMQLNETGYMHNRGRLIVASFLIKNLLHDWRDGEKYFATMLVDYDPLVNNGNWQWVAGSGADSQPYFRIFNPWTQGKKFDKDCEFIKKGFPFLKDVPNNEIHEWDEHYKKYNFYRGPIIDYKKSRVKTLDAYKKALE